MPLIYIYIYGSSLIWWSDNTSYSKQQTDEFTVLGCMLDTGLFRNTNTAVFEVLLSFLPLKIFTSEISEAWHIRFIIMTNWGGTYLMLGTPKLSIKSWRVLYLIACLLSKFLLDPSQFFIIYKIIYNNTGKIVSYQYIELVWYRDGSLHDQQSGYGGNCKSTGAIEVNLGRYCKIFQIQISAISACVHWGLLKLKTFNSLTFPSSNHSPWLCRNLIETGMGFPSLSLCPVNQQYGVLRMRT